MRRPLRPYPTEPWDIASAESDAESASGTDADEDDEDDYVDVFLTDCEAKPPNYGAGQLEIPGMVPASHRQRQMLMATVSMDLDEIMVLREEAMKAATEKRSIWVIVAEELRLAEVLSRIYEAVTVKVINGFSGYDIWSTVDRGRILVELLEQWPREVYLRPSFPALDSELRVAAGRDRAWRSQLYTQRKVEGRAMKLCRRIYDEQLEAGRGAHL